tara:strand:- start:8318 stop:9055 length:738 start_codon:yes stop_codon:yes gene_type:complete
MSTQDFNVNIEFNKHSDPKDFKIVIDRYCQAYSILGDTECKAKGAEVQASRNSDNSFYVPAFVFQSETSGYLVSSYEMTTRVRLSTSRDSAVLFGISSEDRSKDITDAVRKHFDNPVYITTVPKFEFDTFGTLVSSKVSDSTLKNVYVTLKYFLQDQNGKVVGDLDWVRYDSSPAGDGIKTKANETIISSPSKPSALRVEIVYTVRYFGKTKEIRKNYLFNNLDNLDLGERLKQIKFEIVDEDIQ